MNSEQRIAYAEVLTILSHMEMKYQEKIPAKLLDFFKRNCDKNHILQINFDKPFSEQELNKKTISLLAVLDLNYWCETEEKKQILLETYKKNEKRHQQELREKYNPDQIFKKKLKEKFDEKELEKETEIIEYKEESIFKKFINKIKDFFTSKSIK